MMKVLFRRQLDHKKLLVLKKNLHIINSHDSNNDDLFAIGLTCTLLSNLILETKIDNGMIYYV